MKTIYKYPLNHPPFQVFEIELPEESRILAAHFQPNVGICLWALIDNSNWTVKEKFFIAGTGGPLPPPNQYHCQHIGTCFDDRGFVWHVFQLFEKD